MEPTKSRGLDSYLPRALFIERPYATALHSALHFLLRDAFPVEIAGKSNLHYCAIASLPLTWSFIVTAKRRLTPNPPCSKLGYFAANHALSILLSNGAGSFQAAKSFKDGNTPTAIAAGNFNGDGNKRRNFYAPHVKTLLLSLTLLFVTIAPNAQAASCSLANAAGKWGFSYPGTALTPSCPVPIASNGFYAEDASGNISSAETSVAMP